MSTRFSHSTLGAIRTAPFLYTAKREFAGLSGSSIISTKVPSTSSAKSTLFSGKRLADEVFWISRADDPRSCGELLIRIKSSECGFGAALAAELEQLREITVRSKVFLDCVPIDVQSIGWHLLLAHFFLIRVVSKLGRGRMSLPIPKSSRVGGISG